MELDKYGLTPQEMVAVSLYLKTTPLNKSKAASDAGFESPAVFNEPRVKKAVDEQLRIRAERLRLGGDWVLHELKRVYDRCMAEGDLGTAVKTLTQIGKHVDIGVFDRKQPSSDLDDLLLTRLLGGRQRAYAANLAWRPQLSAGDVVHEVQQDEAPVMSFLHPREQSVGALVGSAEPESDVAAAAEADLLSNLTEEEKLKVWMERWRTGKPPGEL